CVRDDLGSGLGSW
nr:immunoglobulin heavy chain junction region [Macaca mulatta]MOX58629.1 immunoglobulin heavy chain junction region [Macaca mulatta]MOX58775.1 immunoglobulin heavy chain junction region [Macaca mulatta]MOX58836.1 immunoglobulin heavy chain junction region [Macaca mulatta]MOX58896.1 immunoglobulin heavy chain junction region [Macaca mulatta]